MLVKPNIWSRIMNSLTSSLEDYLETTYKHIQKNGTVKAVEIAKTLGVSRASVTEALNKLAQINYINYGRYENITMTNAGIKKAQEIFEKHNELQKFFEEILSVETEKAAEIACKIEHIISDDILQKIKQHNDFCLKSKEFLVTSQQQ